MKKTKRLWLAAPLLLLAACGSNNADSAGSGDYTQEVKVEFLTAAQAEPAETVELLVEVTQGEEAVTDADEVMFEVWESGHRTHSEMIEGQHTEEGLYSAETSFDEEGLYIIQAHTTARRLHVMPKLELTIGSPDPDSIVPDDSDDAEGMQHIDGHHGH